MLGYKRILVAVDLSPDTKIVLNRACEIAGQCGAELSIAHVMQPLAVGYTLGLEPSFESLYAEVTRQCRKALLEFAGSVGIPAERVHNLLGSTASEIRHLAKTIDADLVIAGGHGKHGFELLLGSTSSGLSHGIECDLLIVHIHSD